MKKINYVLLVFLFALFTNAFSQQTIEIFEPQNYGLREDCAKKIDPIFLAMFGKSTDFIEKSNTITPVEKNFRGEIVLSAIIKTNNISELKTIESVVVGSVHGNIVTATFEFKKIVDIANLDSSIYIEASIFLHYNLDESVPDTNADCVWNPQGGYISTIKGDSVLIGIMDSGIDWNHRDFIDNDELYPSNQSNWQTRIMYIWDQSLSTDPHYSVSPPDGYTYGLEYSSTEINQAIQGSDTLATNDRNGHGTHVAGIASGDGTSTDNTYIGMAPESNLIVCKYTETTASALDGFDWMIYKASESELNLPVVINFSQGSYLGPHDGTHPFEQSIDYDIQNNGLNLVISAGNSRNYEKHSQNEILEGENQIFKIEVENNVIDSTNKHIQFWYDGSNNFSVRVRPYQIIVIPIALAEWSDPITLGTQATTVNFTNYSGQCIISNLECSYNDDNLIDILITNIGEPKADLWYFDIIDNDISVNKTIHGYIDGEIKLKFKEDISEEYTIGMPGSAANAITVASYNTKLLWLSLNGWIPYTNPNPIGYISDFSSKGPLRDETFSSKPDITAPGKGIGSSYSSNANWDNDWILEENPSNQHAIKQGTSMSAPHVTGACALLLQKFPYLTCSDLKTILKENANTSYPSGDEKDWGAGKLDILSAYKYMVGYYAQGYIPSFQTAYNNHPYLEGLPIESVDDYWDLTLKQRLTNGMILKPSQSVSAYWLGEEIFTTWDSLGNVSSPLGVPDTTEYIDATNNNYRTVDFENGTIYWNGNETIYKYLTSNFYADRTEGLNPLTVIFSDSSTAVNTAITSWYWDFGDNEYSSVQDPTHLYNGEGVYPVSLTVSDGRNSNTETKVNYITVTGENLNDGLVAYYPFNGNANDESGNGNNGTVTGASLTIDRYGNTNNAYNFDGINDYIAYPELLTPSIPSFTLLAWAYTNEVVPIAPVIYKGAIQGDAQIVITPENKWAFAVKLSNGLWYQAVADTITTGIYNFLVGRYYRGDRIEIWVDNILKDQLSIPDLDLFEEAVHHSSIGAYNRGISEQYYFNGIIDDVRIYSRAINEAEIECLYQSGEWIKTDFSATPVLGYLPLNVTFTDESAGNPSPTSWNWDFNGDNIQDSGLRNPSYTYTTAGIYDVSLTTYNGAYDYKKTTNNYIRILDPNYSGFIEGTVILIGGNGDVEDIVISASGFTTSPNSTGYYNLGLYAGTCNVNASLENYQSVTNSNVEVVAGEFTEDISFILISSDIAISVIQDGSGDYTTIQAAIDAADNGDYISVHPGTYTENINYNGKNIIVGSLFFTTHNSSYISQTIIDGNQNGSVVIFGTGINSNALLSGLKIINASDSTGGGIYCYNASPKINNCTIQSNISNGFYLSNSSPQISNSQILNNTGSAIYCIDANSFPNISGNTYTGNQYDGVVYAGGSMTVNGTWHSDGCYFVILGDIMISTGSKPRLTIEPAKQSNLLRA